MSSEVPTGTGITDNDYTSRSGDAQPVPVVKDDSEIETGVDAPTDFEGGENSDEQLAKDDTDAIDESNIIEQRTRGKKADGSMREPDDDEGLPGPEDGTSSTS